MSQVTRSQVIQLYKQLIRYQKELTLTDKSYYLDRIRCEFKKNSTLDKSEDIDFYYQKGLVFLKNKRVI